MLILDLKMWFSGLREGFEMISERHVWSLYVAGFQVMWVFGVVGLVVLGIVIRTIGREEGVRIVDIKMIKLS